MVQLELSVFVETVDTFVKEVDLVVIFKVFLDVEDMVLDDVLDIAEPGVAVFELEFGIILGDGEKLDRVTSMVNYQLLFVM